jgi:hypothetical protein
MSQTSVPAWSCSIKLWLMSICERSNNQQATQQANEAEVLGNHLHDAHSWVGMNPGVFTDPDDSAWDAIYVLYDKQEQLEDNLAVGVDQLIAD